MKQKYKYARYNRRHQPGLPAQMLIEVIGGILFLPLTVLKLLFGGIGGVSTARRYKRRSTRFGRVNYLRPQRR